MFQTPLTCIFNVESTKCIYGRPYQKACRILQEGQKEMTRHKQISNEMKCRKAKKKALKRLFGLT